MPSLKPLLKKSGQPFRPITSLDSQRITSPFEDLARQVQRRVSLLAFAKWLGRTHWIAGAVVLLVVLGGRRLEEWRSGEVWIALSLFAIWLAAGLIIARVKRPGVMTALLTLDHRGGWKDQFSSAWEFLRKGSLTPGEALHVRSADHRIGAAAAALPAALPLPRLRAAWIVPVVALLFALSPLGRTTPEAVDLLLTEEMKTAAGEQAVDLKKSADRIAEMESLSEAEQEELEALRVEVENVADRLADAEGLTAGEMLDALEARARAAERLAEKMGLGDEAWASAEMLAEMKEHPDTADLALAIEDQDAAPAASEAETLRQVLEQPEITRETNDRLTDALDQIMAAAVDEDLERPVGERVGNASTKMLDQQPVTAAREFGELAKHFRFLMSREEAKEKLEDLASSLREAGSEVSGSELQQMEKIANEGRSGEGLPEGLQSLNEGAVPEDLQKMLAPQMTQSGAGPGNETMTPGQSGEGQQGGAESAPVPGQAQEAPGGEPGEAGSLAMSAPVPGEPQQDGAGSGEGVGPSDQSQEGEGTGGMLSAPVPGEEPQDAGQGGDLAMAGGSGNQSGQGGNQAGSGTAALQESESEALAATSDSEVIAQINESGDSTVRAVEGQARAEQAGRSRQEIMADFLAAEEQALDGQALPLSRREHVIRYFSEIRRQFEESDSAP